MSRGFIDKHIRLKETGVSRLPGVRETEWDAGHEYQDDNTGNIYHNDGLRGFFSLFGSPANRYDLHERFERKPQVNVTVTFPASPTMEIVGLNAASANVTDSTIGGWNFATAAGDEDQIIITPHLDTDQTPWQTTIWRPDAQPLFECVIRTGTLITTTALWAGLKLTNTSVTATDADQVFFRYENGVNGGRWQIIDSTGGTDNAQDSGFAAVALSTVYHLRVVVAPDFRPYYMINGDYVGRGAVLTEAADLIPYIGAQCTVVSAARNFDAMYLHCGRSYVEL